MVRKTNKKINTANYKLMDNKEDSDNQSKMNQIHLTLKI